MKVWTSKDKYTFSENFNRYEQNNEYCMTWAIYLNIIDERFENKTDWTINDIPTIFDYSRIKKNINTLVKALNLDYENLPVVNTYNYNFDYIDANNLETRCEGIYDIIGVLQFRDNVTGLVVCGNTLKLGGVN